jgi:hypothetical protein
MRSVAARQSQKPRSRSERFKRWSDNDKSGVGHESVSLVYCFPELPDNPVVATFGQGTDEGVPEFEALNLALG